MSRTTGGDLARAWFSAKHTDRKAACLCTVFVDRLIGLTGLTLLSVVMLLRIIERLAFITQPENRSGTLMPGMFGGRFALLERPLVGSGGNLWITYSKDLKYWGESRVVIAVRGGSWLVTAGERESVNHGEDRAP